MVAAPLTRTAFVDFANASDRQFQHDQLAKRILLFGGLGLGATAVVAAVLPMILGAGWEQTRTVTLLLGAALPWRLLLGPVVALGLTTGPARRVVGWEFVRMAVLVVAILIGSASVISVSAAVAVATIGSITWAYRRAVHETEMDPAGVFSAAAMVVSIGVVVSAILV